MLRKLIVIILLCLFRILLPAQSYDELAESIVFIEAKDEEGNRITLGTGVIVRNGYVATNYHFVAGAAQVQITKHSEKKIYLSEGYLSVDENKDLIVISVPGLKGKAAKIRSENLEGDTVQISFSENLTEKKLEWKTAQLKGNKILNDFELQEFTSDNALDCTGGPIYHRGIVSGFATAGYFDGRYYLYVVPITHIRSHLRGSFIIKSYASLQDEKPIFKSYFHQKLMDMLEAVLWLPFENAVTLAKKKQKKILVDIYTEWCGWCKIMEQNTYSKKSIIKYINENFYSVRLNAEGNDSIHFQGQLFTYQENKNSHELAYSLLEGNMGYPATVFLDKDINLLTVVPGYMDMRKMTIILHYFNENIYQEEGKSYEEFEVEFLNRKEEY